MDGVTMETHMPLTAPFPEPLSPDGCWEVISG